LCTSQSILTEKTFKSKCTTKNIHVSLFCSICLTLKVYLLQAQAARREFLCNGPGSLTGYRRYGHQVTTTLSPGSREPVIGQPGAAILGVLQLGSLPKSEVLEGNNNQRDHEEKRGVRGPPADCQMEIVQGPSSAAVEMESHASAVQASDLVAAGGSLDDKDPGLDEGAIHAGLTIVFSPPAHQHQVSRL
jgi:hypothetical protein